MSETDPIVQRIDALVRKRRSFVATPAGEAAPPLGAPAEDRDDIPLLTEIVDLSAVSGEAAGAPAPPPLEPLINALAADLSAAVADRLEAELVGIVDSALAQFDQELRRGVSGAIDAARRDFLARRLQLRLPLDDDPEA